MNPLKSGSSEEPIMRGAIFRSKDCSIKQNKDFVDFLRGNPYTSIRKKSTLPSISKNQETDRTNGWNSFDDTNRLDYQFLENDFLAPRESKQTQKANDERLPADNSPTKKFNNLDEMATDNSIIGEQKSINQESPRAEGGKSKLDPSQKKMLEAMQKMIVSLEQEVRKLKKSNTDYESKAKKLSEQVTSFNAEKESFARIKEAYEKKIKKFETHLTNQDEHFSALKKVLTLSDNEILGKFEKKIGERLKVKPVEQTNTKSKLNPTQQTHESLKTPTRTPNRTPKSPNNFREAVASSQH